MYVVCGLHKAFVLLLTDRGHPSWGGLLHANNSLRPQHARLVIYASVQYVDANYVLAVLVGILAEEYRGHLAEVVVDELAE